MNRIVLIGGGHAHVHLLKEAASRRLPTTELVLVSPDPRHHYSGMVPGYLEGSYAEPQLSFDLAALARAAGARFHRGAATALSLARREVTVDTGVSLAFDRVSLDIGSAPVGINLPGVAAHAATVRPMSRAVALRDRLDLLLEGRVEGPLPVAVVGAGAAGFEVALAVHRRIVRTGRAARVTLVDAGDRILPDFSPRVRARATHILERTGISVRLEARATGVTREALLLDAGEELVSRLTVWLAGAAPPPLLGASDLPRSSDGFFLVDAELRAVAASADADAAAAVTGSPAGGPPDPRPPAWGAGDCIALQGAPWMPRAGVYAVRQSPVLARNVLTDEAPASFTPQRSFLALMNTADGRALLRWKGVVTHARWAWWLKDAIDRRFMARYQP
jgi:NADH dehydrogenase FAD-containing subunit